MNCYRCGAEIGNHDHCLSCGADVSLYQKVKRVSNSYYNDGLQKASVRNLSGAIISLKASLKFNKENVNARNLLGLIYYEMGEVVSALGEWIISSSYQSEDNVANRYIDAIRHNRSALDTANQTIKKYNQALLYCKQDSRDLAIIQLKKVLSLNPKLVKAHQLLALLYIQEEKYDQAKKTLRSAGKIDTDNTTTLRYLKEVNIRLREGSSKKKKSDDLISYQSGNEMIIMPKRFQETSIGATLLYVFIGLLVGAAVTAFLIVPGVKNRIRSQMQQQSLEASDMISENGKTISELEEQIAALESDLDEANNNNEWVEIQTRSYEALLAAYIANGGGDVLTAGNQLALVDVSHLSETATNLYNDLNAEINESYLSQLYDQGYSDYSNGNYESAIEKLKAVCDKDMNYREGMAVYYLAQSYRKNGEDNVAKTYYQYVIDHYPNTESAKTAENYVD
ncbi:MAG: tetratricopeptide repeat protein [Agathobacter sp.]|nr:tetratricopeptide repeat protein [Agathobacter sp.]